MMKSIKVKFFNPEREKDQTVSFSKLGTACFNARSYANQYGVPVVVQQPNEIVDLLFMPKDENWQPFERPALVLTSKGKAACKDALVNAE